ncbi:MAG: outer membrane protein assembly factor BamE [Candidatus Competibacteraceae bacterium]|nr:outer membrane protein assembly factor BamE [Candidatus Competibacteraceae bacterium]MCB1822808.1 outer membrane protein assembly factor BamE [Candidatus Competibacteraceae bacterium]
MSDLSLRAMSILLLALMAGCESLLPSFYTVPVRQGNYIDPAPVSELRPGMTRQQVQRIMGTPLVTDPFHQNRWDYYYQYGKGNKIAEQRRVTLFFSGDALDRVDAETDN